MASEFTGQLLPANPFPPSAFHAAYNQCLAFEAEADANRVQPIICARILGHLLRLTPAGNPQEQLQPQIAATNSDHANLMQLATFYLKNFIRTCKSCFLLHRPTMLMTLSSQA